MVAKLNVDQSWRTCPTAWFAKLERAKETLDFEAAAEAVRELRRLGVYVEFRRAAESGVAHAR